MNEVSVKLKIADREYTLRASKEDAPLLQKASELLAERLREKKQLMRVHDRQDLLAMVAFDSIFNELQQEEGRLQFNSTLSQKIADIDKLIPTDMRPTEP